MEWTILDTTQLITEEQMQFFHTLREKEAVVPEIDIGDNFRPLQPLNGRKVQYYPAPVQPKSGYERMRAQTTLLLVLVLTW